MRDNRTINRMVCAVASVLLLAGCTSEITTPGARSDGKVRVNFDMPLIVETVTGQPETRATLEANTTVRVVACVGTTYKADQTYYMKDGRLEPCTVNSDGSFKAADTENELALIPDTYNFYAITPALPLSADKSKVTVPNGIDYASSLTPNVAVAADRTLTLIQLDRKCSKIVLVVKKADDNTAMTELSVASAGVTISTLPTSVDVPLNADIAPATGAATLHVPAAAFALSGAISTATTYLLPRLGTDRMKIDYNLTYKVLGTAETKTVSGTMGNVVLEKGKSYTFTLTMRKTGASLSVTDWVESNQEVAVGQSLDYTDNGKPWFFLSSGDAKNPNDGTTTMNWYVANSVTESTYNPTPLKVCPDGWNVATQCDWGLAWIYKYSFLSPNFSATYWTERESVNSYSFIYSMTSGFTGSNGYLRKDLYAVRCIRPKTASGVKYPYVAEDGKTIVSRDNAGGCLPGSLLNSDEIIYLNTSPLVMYDSTSPINKTSGKLEVATKDENNGAKVSINDWMNRGTGTDGSGCPTGWRMPTQRELLLIAIMRTQLNKVDPFKEDSYWCSTSSTATDGWSTNVAGMTLGVGSKTAGWYIRCVRDVQ